jgi:hypothetical protein
MVRLNQVYSLAVLSLNGFTVSRAADIFFWKIVGVPKKVRKLAG